MASLLQSKIFVLNLPNYILTVISLFRGCILLSYFFNLLFIHALIYSWFARDVKKNKTKKLSILPSFYFHEVLQHLNIFDKKSYGSKGFFVLRERTLEVPGFCVTRHLADGQESSYVG